MHAGNGPSRSFNASSFKQRLKAYAASIGLDALGIASAAPFEEEEALLRRRLEADQYPAFVSRDPEARCRPDAVLPGAKSIVTAAISYLTADHLPRSYRARKLDGTSTGGSLSRAAARAGNVSRDGAEAAAQPGPLRGRISRYAWGPDYHRILHEKLEAVRHFMEREAPHPIRCVATVDTAPPVDRAAAHRAGIGWYGKNNCLYIPERGSWVFLGEIYTDWELDPDPVEPDAFPSCGECDLCIQACPTGALTDYELDPGLCISQLTQASGDIPPELRPKMGRWVFGCDICQLVCPWNRDALPGASSEAFESDDDEQKLPSLVRLLSMSKGEFRRTYGATAAGWRGKKPLQRNAAIALGNIRDPEAVPALRRALADDPKPVVRSHAAWALGRIGTEEARKGLEEAYRLEVDSSAQEDIRAALEACAKS